jgi:hypothetical protein
MSQDLGNIIIARELVAIALIKSRSLMDDDATHLRRLLNIIAQLDSALIDLDAMISIYKSKQHHH